MTIHTQQRASAAALSDRYGSDAAVLVNRLALDHHDAAVRGYWRGVLGLLPGARPEHGRTVSQ